MNVKRIVKNLSFLTRCIMGLTKLKRNGVEYYMTLNIITVAMVELVMLRMEIVFVTLLMIKLKKMNL